MRVGIKYCGGCNPRYDRVAAAKTLARDFPRHDFLGVHGVADPDVLLVFCGCRTACVDVSGLHPKQGALWIRDEEECAKARSALAAILSSRMEDNVT
ncbi:MAG: hypothetical protein LBE84_06105 [Planctomycetota bacterium]|jgi:hypothetical protein|nr:hypothetical protein [Planctomycetota bacterium]